jgi:hypothetical protein
VAGRSGFVYSRNYLELVAGLGQRGVSVTGRDGAFRMPRGERLAWPEQCSYSAGTAVTGGTGAALCGVSG